MVDQAQVTLVGVVPEQPSKSETETGIPTATFHVLVERRWTGRAGQECDEINYVEVHAVGHPANSISKYWCPNCEVVIAGELKMRSVFNSQAQAVNELYVEARVIGFVSPRACLEAAQIRGRSW